MNVKWYTHHAGLLDVDPRALPDDYLVLPGPRTAAGSSRGAAHPGVIAAVYLFKVKVGRRKTCSAGAKSSPRFLRVICR